MNPGIVIRPARCGLSFLAVALICALAAPALADEGVPAGEIDVPAPESPRAIPDPSPEAARTLSDPSADEAGEDLWSFRVAAPGYVWVPNLKGTFVIEDTPIHYDLSLGNVFNLVFHNLKGYYAFAGEARRDRLSVRVDTYFVDFDNLSLNDLNKQVQDLPNGWESPLAVNMHLALALFTPSVSFTLFETPLDLGPFDDLRIDSVVGFRYAYMEMDARVVDSLIPGAIGRKVLQAREHYWEALPLGLEVELGFCENWSLLATTMLGGWGMGESRKTTTGQADFLLTYRLSDHLRAEAGGRWFDFNMKGEEVDTQIHNVFGPIFRVMWEF